MIAVVASLFVYFGMKSGLVLTALDIPGSSYGIYAASVIAGFSESLVPNVIRSISTDPPSVAPHSPRQELVVLETPGETVTRTPVLQDHGSRDSGEGKISG